LGLPRSIRRWNLTTLRESDLAAALQEAAVVGELLKTVPLTGSAVVRSAIVPALGDCGFLHIACHAYFNERDPAGSGFRLADGSVFSARDFTEGNLRVHFAVLSACESGLVEVAAGGEIAGIAPSLLLCGASGVVAALWRVPDQHTLELMRRFYSGMVAGRQDPARSLAEAQRDLLKHAPKDAPCPWAAFQLFGSWVVDWGKWEA
jgi:CHAT domain-containing protein